ncbi:hypothetical protein L53_04655 [Hyphomonas sp. L-53-1-40]|nr:hypothetical protein L53_04655 [Hyphomonas sp. L-53-1-40]
MIQATGYQIQPRQIAPPGQPSIAGRPLPYLSDRWPSFNRATIRQDSMQFQANVVEGDALIEKTIRCLRNIHIIDTV